MLGPTLRFTQDNIIAITGGGYDAPAERAARSHEPGHPDPVRFCSEAAGCPHRLPDLCGLCRWAGCPGGDGQPGHRGPEPGGRTGGPQAGQGDELPFLAPKTALPRMEERRTSHPMPAGNERVLRVILGPQDDAFTPKAWTPFWASPIM